MLVHYTDDPEGRGYWRKNSWADTLKLLTLQVSQKGDQPLENSGCVKLSPPRVGGEGKIATPSNSSVRKELQVPIP